MSNLQIFNHSEFGAVRTVGTTDNPMFCLADICKPLGLTPKGVKQRLSDEVISNYPLSTAGGEQQALFINEDGLYDVILDSRKPIAKKFRKWVTSEVLPAIRKQGGYIATQQDDTPEEIMARALIVAQQTIDKHKQLLDAANQQNQQLQGENELLQSENHTLAPKAAYTDEVLQSTSTFTLTQVAHSLGLKSVHVLTDLLSKRGILYRQSGQWQPSAKVASKGYFSTRTAKFIRSDNSIGSSISTVVTEMGRAYLHTLLCS